MCGIFGLTNRNAVPLATEVPRAALERLEHRGPDDLGWLTFTTGCVRRGREVDEAMAAEAMLLHRRLSILDLSSAGWQPMSTADGRYHLTFNGEIYNYLELRQELQRLGHTFHSETDTEVLLAAFAQWGAASLNRFVGMFAFAILDSTERRLFLARDCFGIKPLYHARWRDGFAFSSEIEPLLDLPGVGRTAHPQNVYDYLRFGLTDHGPETLFADIKQLQPAHYLDLPLDDPAAARPVRYWNLDLDRHSDLSFEEAAERMRDLFVESVRLHLRSDVPVGAALSGGIDSSAIVMTMRQLQPDLDLHTFSYVASEAGINEERWMDLIGSEAKVTAHKVRPDPGDLVGDLESLLRAQELPFSSTSMYAQYRVFALARDAGIKVMLDGQGADELLAGYPGFLAARLASVLTRGAWREAGQVLNAAAGSVMGGRLGTLARAVRYLVPGSLEGAARGAIESRVTHRWISSGWLRRHDVSPMSIRLGFGTNAFRERLHQALTETSVPTLLRYEDRNSMAFSIESRVPFLTPELASFAFSLPDEYLIARDGTSKAVFRRAMRGIVPDAILDRRDKIGFATPERRWLLEMRPWVESILFGARAASIPALNIPALRRDWEDLVQGKKVFDFRVWRWINLVLWAERYEVQFD